MTDAAAVPPCDRARRARRHVTTTRPSPPGTRGAAGSGGCGAGAEDGDVRRGRARLPRAGPAPAPVAEARARSPGPASAFGGRGGQDPTGTLLRVAASEVRRAAPGPAGSTGSGVQVKGSGHRRPQAPRPASCAESEPGASNGSRRKGGLWGLSAGVLAASLQLLRKPSRHPTLFSSSKHFLPLNLFRISL